MRKPRLPSPALVVAMLALGVALTSSAFAAGIVPLARHALTANTATNAKKLGGLTRQQIARSVHGARGPQGPAGPAGAPGSASVSVVTASFTLAASGSTGDSAQVTVTCTAGTKAVSGGFNGSESVLGLDTQPTQTDDGWSIVVANLSTASVTGTAYAVCFG
jgi:hypothetical protein